MLELSDQLKGGQPPEGYKKFHQAKLRLLSVSSAFSICNIDAVENKRCREKILRVDLQNDSVRESIQELMRESNTGTKPGGWIKRNAPAILVIPVPIEPGSLMHQDVTIDNGSRR